MKTCLELRLVLIAVKLLLGLQAFTFHDVSINTDTTQSRKDSVLNFTFHDVSINTVVIVQAVSSLSFFTFHDVSINTNVNSFDFHVYLPLHSTMFLLIPVVYLSLQYRYNLTTFCQSCHFIIFKSRQEKWLDKEFWGRKDDLTSFIL